MHVRFYDEKSLKSTLRFFIKFGHTKYKSVYYDHHIVNLLRWNLVNNYIFKLHMYVNL